MTTGNIVKLVVSLTACLGAGWLGSIFTRPAIDGWYRGLAKPAFTPPEWLFGPVWTALYILMAIALYRIWTTRSRPGKSAALGLFAVQLALNAAWSGVFFGLKSPAGGLAVIAALWLAISATIVAFRRLSAIAAWLLVPYLLWVSYAAALNFAIWRLNP